ncbi:hypothetical protein TruAng_000251 [Truncatella angustata]|nr:hypothetical protein TruAng_000251 [Truncatella angustata]
MPTADDQSFEKRDAVDRNVTSEPRGTSISPMPEPSSEITCNYEFSYVEGFFVDYAKTAEQYEGGKVITQPGLGLLDRAYDGEDTHDANESARWARFANYVQRLNSQSKDGESYKVLFLIRHGFGVHNQVMEKVGSQAWNHDWSHRDGDGELIWADAHLVDAGIAQAKSLGEFWLNGVQNEGMPLPGTIYTSPLARCLETTKLVYAPVFSAHQRKLQPTIKERLREFLTDHTCDRRSTRSWIHGNYPDYIIEEDFGEHDVLWHADKAESMEEHVVRKQKLLEDIFTHDASPFISLTTHSYAISALLSAVGAPMFRVGEGVMVPLFVKAEKIALGTTKGV